jgi:predicted DNA-binding ribbon-helix-helix protein
MVKRCLKNRGQPELIKIHTHYWEQLKQIAHNVSLFTQTETELTRTYRPKKTDPSHGAGISVCVNRLLCAVLFVWPHLLKVAINSRIS